MESKIPVPVVSPPRSSDDETSAVSVALGQSQIDIEVEKSAIARTLHDDIGGLLCGAVMDLGWIANQPDLSDTVKARLARAQALMGAAIDIKRRLIENLRPTLLDNIGLYPTLRWHMKTTCEAASVPYTESFPELESALNSETRIGVFRIFQEALKNVLSERAPSDVSLNVEVIGDILHCHLVHRSEGCSSGVTSSPSPETSMRCRADRVGGSFQWSDTGTGRHLHLQVPLSSGPIEGVE
jgi:signal transduction histidine kinase